MIKTAESVSPMHPDKICDRISDAILDACLEQDPDSRVAAETMGGHGIITITGEITSKAKVNIHDVVRRIVGVKYGVQVNIVSQSPEIAKGVDSGGAGDQGIMVGYACDSEYYIPRELWLARNLCKHLYDMWALDGKTQVTIEHGEIKAIVASWQNVSQRALKDVVYSWLSDLPADWYSVEHVDVFANPAGDWDVGGFEADTGLTGRKLAVDNYGPHIPIGGGCFSGKDASKVDRSGAYKARQLAVRALVSNKASEAYVYLAYAIGRKYPVMAKAVVDGVERDLIGEGILEKLTPKAIIKDLRLQRPMFGETAEWGHFGNGFVWDNPN